MQVFSCHICRTELQAEDAQVGQLVRCPHCKATLRVPAGSAAIAARELAGVGASSAPATNPSAPKSPPSSPQAMIGSRVASPMRGPGGGKRYGFNCAYCSSRLEATESMGAQEGACPTCGNTIVIPILDRYGRLIDPITRQIIKQDPHPVHAYAAAGERAPKILRQTTGAQVIQCPRCASMSPITSNNCKSCGMPFTMEGTTLEAAGGNNGFCVASLVLGIIGLPAGCTILIPLLAVIFGILGYNQVSKDGGEGGGRGLAIAGMICGGIGLAWGAWADFMR